MNGTSTTRISLLDVLRDQRGDDNAWGEFVRVYGPAVVMWCRERGLQHDDALDVTQDVLLRFWQTSKQFDYNPRGRFRSYLEQVARSALVRWAEQAGAPHDQATRSLLEKTPEREDLLARLAEAYDTELVAIAMAEVKTRVRPHTWQAFELLALEHRSGADVAATLNIEINTAYVARRKVQRMIREIIDRLEGPLAPPRAADAHGNEALAMIDSHPRLPR
ncbi:MAG: sigma-70 family RNA polymerase sigma factor [Planctomycetota bacterium]|nr:sigma-70 family RNA polymerase sigma factor [Planctomycetota bacterium]